MDPSSTGRLTRSKSLSRASSPHPTGSAATPSVTTPSHRTDRPWNEVTKGGSTPRDAALPPPRPDHPFESANQFTRLRSADDDASDDGTQRSADLLTPGDLAQREDVDFPPGFDGDMLAPPAGDILAPPVSSLSTLEDLVRANAAGITELREMIRANTANITVLSNTVTTNAATVTTNDLWADEHHCLCLVEEQAARARQEEAAARARNEEAAARGSAAAADSGGVSED